MFSLFTQQRFTAKKNLWDKGINKNLDYFTKQYPPTHHQHIRPRFISKLHIVHNLKKITEYSFQKSDPERVCSWENSNPRQFRPFRTFIDNSRPRFFRPVISLSGVTSMDSLTYRGLTLMGSLFRSLTNNLCILHTSQNKREWIVHLDH